MSEKMKAFLEALSKDKELFDKLNAIPFATEEEKIQKAIAFAKDELGIELTEEDFKKPEVVKGELNDDELDAVAGGDTCFCVVGGGGHGSPIEEFYDCTIEEFTCGCAIGGAGTYTCDGKKHERCYCVGGGSGNTGIMEWIVSDR